MRVRAILSVIQSNDVGVHLTPSPSPRIRIVLFLPIEREVLAG